MYIHSKRKIKELKTLRRRGYSIGELMVRLSMPKTTIWHHIHNISVLPNYLPILEAKRGGSAIRTQKNWKIARERAKELLKSSNKNLAIAAAMLYWGEGSKKKCELINSDGEMIRFYLNILHKVFNIPEESIKGTIRIFSGMNKEECLNYWSFITKIAKDKFIVRLNDGCSRGRTKYGMCRITVRKGGNILKLIHSLIEQISNKEYSKIV